MADFQRRALESSSCFTPDCQGCGRSVRASLCLGLRKSLCRKNLAVSRRSRTDCPLESQVNDYLRCEGTGERWPALNEVLKAQICCIFQPRRGHNSRNARSCAPVFCSPELTRTYNAARFAFKRILPSHRFSRSTEVMPKPSNFSLGTQQGKAPR